MQRLLARLHDTTVPATGRRALLAGGAMGDISAVALPRSDGAFDVALWRSASLWNPTTKVPVAVAPVTATLTFAAATRVETHRPAVDASVTVLASGATTASVPVDGSVTLVRCSAP